GPDRSATPFATSSPKRSPIAEQPSEITRIRRGARDGTSSRSRCTGATASSVFGAGPASAARSIRGGAPFSALTASRSDPFGKLRVRRNHKAWGVLGYDDDSPRGASGDGDALHGGRV